MELERKACIACAEHIADLCSCIVSQLYDEKTWNEGVYALCIEKIAEAIKEVVREAP